MKVNTDGVLLGAWTNVENVRHALDVGTGTGVIALMLAQRAPGVLIDAVEKDDSSARQAKKNITNSPWNNRITLFQERFQDFAAKNAGQYDLIVSNPPYFANALLSPVKSRTLAKHTEELSHEALLECAGKILHPHGNISVIFPFTEGMHFIEQAGRRHLFCTRKTTIYTTKNKVPKRLLLNFSPHHKKLSEDELIIHENNGSEYSPEYKNLTKDFYLKF